MSERVHPITQQQIEAREELTRWITTSDDKLVRRLDKALRSFGWPDYNVPRPGDNTWPGLALDLAARLSGLQDALAEIRAVALNPAKPRNALDAIIQKADAALALNTDGEATER